MVRWKFPAMSVECSVCIDNCSKTGGLWGTDKSFSETFWVVLTLPMLPAALLVLSGDVKQVICSLSVTVTGFNLLGFGWGLGVIADGSSSIRESGEMFACSVKFTFGYTLFLSGEHVFLGKGTGLWSILPVTVTTMLVAVVSKVVIVVIKDKIAYSKSATT